MNYANTNQISLENILPLHLYSLLPGTIGRQW